MRLRFVVCLAFLVFHIIALSFLAQPAAADTEGPDGGVLLLTMASVMVSGANLVSMTLGDGSTGLGIAGVAVGTGLAVYAPIADTADDWGVFVGIGAATAVIGFANIMVARHDWNDPELLGARLQPVAGTFDGQRWYGLQLIVP